MDGADDGSLEICKINFAEMKKQVGWAWHCLSIRHHTHN